MGSLADPWVLCLVVRVHKDAHTEVVARTVEATLRSVRRLSRSLSERAPSRTESSTFPRAVRRWTRVKKLLCS